jgi:hypothetical protein
MASYVSPFCALCAVLIDCAFACWRGFGHALQKPIPQIGGPMTKVLEQKANTSEPDKATKEHLYLKDRVEKSWFARFVDILEHLVSWLR